MWQASKLVLTHHQKRAAVLLLTCLVVELHLQHWGFTHQLRNHYKAAAWADAA
jgi:hypothetical protein